MKVNILNMWINKKIISFMSSINKVKILMKPKIFDWKHRLEIFADKGNDSWNLLNKKFSHRNSTHTYNNENICCSWS